MQFKKKVIAWGPRLALALAIAAQTAAQVLTPTGTVTTIGGFNAGFVDGNNSVSQFNDPWGLTVSSNGRLYIADSGNNAIRVLNPANNTVTTFTTELLNRPEAVIFDSTGRLLVANRGGGNVLRFNTDGRFFDVFAAGLVNPTALSIDFDGNIYVAETAGRVRQYDSEKTLLLTYTVPANFVPALRGVAVISDGSVIASDSVNNVLWKFQASGGTPTVFAGTRGAGGFANGDVNEGRFNQPHQIAAAKNNSIIVADRMNHRVRMVDSTGITSTVYGDDPTEWANDPIFPGWDDGPAATAWAREPVGVVATSDGTIFSSEVYYDIIRKIAGATYPTNSNGGGTPNLPGAERNRISLGFAGGEASSDFIGAPGQYFIAPVVMTVVPLQEMFGLQFISSSRMRQRLP